MSRTARSWTATWRGSLCPPWSAVADQHGRGNVPVHPTRGVSGWRCLSKCGCIVAGAAPASVQFTRFLEQLLPAQKVFWKVQDPHRLGSISSPTGSFELTPGGIGGRGAFQIFNAINRIRSCRLADKSDERHHSKTSPPGVTTRSHVRFACRQ